MQCTVSPTVSFGVCIFLKKDISTSRILTSIIPRKDSYSEAFLQVRHDDRSDMKAAWSSWRKIERRLPTKCLEVTCRSRKSWVAMVI